jgi:hypothetical protein
VLAIEVQPVGIMAPIYLIAYELGRMIQARRYRLEFDRVLKMVLGGVLGLAASPNPAEWGKEGSIHFLYGYFFEARLYRHLPELAVFTACLWVHIWRRDYMQWPFPLVASLATLFIRVFIAHRNYFYTLFGTSPHFFWCS